MSGKRLGRLLALGTPQQIRNPQDILLSLIVNSYYSASAIDCRRIRVFDAFVSACDFLSLWPETQILLAQEVKSCLYGQFLPGKGLWRAFQIFTEAPLDVKAMKSLHSIIPSVSWVGCSLFCSTPLICSSTSKCRTSSQQNNRERRASLISNELDAMPMQIWYRIEEVLGCTITSFKKWMLWWPLHYSELKLRVVVFEISCVSFFKSPATMWRTDM